jgi:hypothetical protein
MRHFKTSPLLRVNYRERKAGSFEYRSEHNKWLNVSGSGENIRRCKMMCAMCTKWSPLPAPLQDITTLSRYMPEDVLSSATFFLSYFYWLYICSTGYIWLKSRFGSNRRLLFFFRK